MEKSRIRPVKVGKGLRMSYSRQKEVLEMPNLIEVQKESYDWFLREGLKEALLDRKILIRDCSNFKGLSRGYYRICIRTQEENERLKEILYSLAGKEAGK